ncbi:hypothetical protein HOF40_04545 [Candidatus Parcubacteria bacterium]|nr:hypothetical protein [Candidatus Parcubacteria bacterium]
MSNQKEYNVDMRIYFAFRGEWAGRLRADECRVIFDKTEFERIQALHGEDPSYRLFSVTVPDSRTARLIFATVTRAAKRSGKGSRIAKAMALEFATKLLEPGRTP